MLYKNICCEYSFEVPLMNTLQHNIIMVYGEIRKYISTLSCNFFLNSSTGVHHMYSICLSIFSFYVITSVYCLLDFIGIFMFTLLLTRATVCQCLFYGMLSINGLNSLFINYNVNYFNWFSHKLLCQLH